MSQDVTLDFQPSSLVALVGCLLMIIFAALRWRRQFRWGEYVVAQLLTAVTLSAALINIRIGFGSYAPPLGLTAVIQLAQALTILAAPVAVLLVGVLVVGRAVQLIMLHRSDHTDYHPLPLIGGMITIGLPIVGLAVLGRRPA